MKVFVLLAGNQQPFEISEMTSVAHVQEDPWIFGSNKVHDFLVLGP